MLNPVKRIWRRWRWERHTNPKRAVQQAVVFAAVIVLAGFALVSIWGDYGWVFTSLQTRPGVVMPSSVDTVGFDGFFSLVKEESFQSLRREIESTKDEQFRANLEAILDFEIRLFEKLRIENGVLTAGDTPTQEFSLRNAKISKGVLVGQANWHEDIFDPGDFSRVYIRLELRSDQSLLFAFDESPEIQSEVLVYQPADPPDDWEQDIEY